MQIETVKLLDHGYLSFIESWGSDERIVEAARMSTGKGFLGWGPKSDGAPGDEKLLRYLYENKHHTPFEMAGLIVEVKAPIMVYREWHRHRTMFYNEMSARYTPLPNENYMPTIERLMANAGGTNRQAGTIADSEVLTLDAALAWQVELADLYDHAERVYQSGLKRGIPKELARLSVPVARYSRMRAGASLRNWLAFLTLREAPGAQKEIRVYANAVSDSIAKLFPRTHELYVGK